MKWTLPVLYITRNLSISLERWMNIALASVLYRCNTGFVAIALPLQTRFTSAINDSCSYRRFLHTLWMWQIDIGWMDGRTDGRTEGGIRHSNKRHIAEEYSSKFVIVKVYAMFCDRLIVIASLNAHMLLVRWSVVHNLSNYYSSVTGDLQLTHRPVYNVNAQIKVIQQLMHLT